MKRGNHEVTKSGVTGSIKSAASVGLANAGSFAGMLVKPASMVIVLALKNPVFQPDSD